MALLFESARTIGFYIIIGGGRLLWYVFIILFAYFLIRLSIFSFNARRTSSKEINATVLANVSKNLI